MSAAKKRHRKTAILKGSEWASLSPVAPELEQRTVGLVPGNETWGNAPREHRALAWLAAFASIGCTPDEPRPPIDGLLNARVLGVGGKAGLARDPRKPLVTQEPAPAPWNAAAQRTQAHRGCSKDWLTSWTPDEVSDLGVAPDMPALTPEAMREFLLTWPVRAEIHPNLEKALCEGNLVWRLKPLRQLIDEVGDPSLRPGPVSLTDLCYTVRDHRFSEGLRLKDVKRLCAHRELAEDIPCRECALVGLGAVRDIVRAVLEKAREEHLRLLPERWQEGQLFIKTVLEAIYKTCVADDLYAPLRDEPGALPWGPVGRFARSFHTDSEGRIRTDERVWYASEQFLGQVRDVVSYWRAHVGFTFIIMNQNTVGRLLAKLHVADAFPGVVWAELLNVFSPPTPGHWPSLRCCLRCGRFWVFTQRQGPGRPRERFCSDKCGVWFHDYGSGESPR